MEHHPSNSWPPLTLPSAQAEFVRLRLEGVELEVCYRRVHTVQMMELCRTKLHLPPSHPVFGLSTPRFTRYEVNDDHLHFVWEWGSVAQVGGRAGLFNDDHLHFVWEWGNALIKEILNVETGEVISIRNVSSGP